VSERVAANLSRSFPRHPSIRPLFAVKCTNRFISYIILFTHTKMPPHAHVFETRAHAFTLRRPNEPTMLPRTIRSASRGSPTTALARRCVGLASGGGGGGGGGASVTTHDASDRVARRSFLRLMNASSSSSSVPTIGGGGGRAYATVRTRVHR